MDYEFCVKACLEDATERGDGEDARLYQQYPIPDEVEWRECLNEVTDWDEDLTNPFHCMGKYEIRLGKRGIPTVLARIVEELREAARASGIPPEHVDDAVKLFALQRESLS